MLLRQLCTQRARVRLTSVVPRLSLVRRASTTTVPEVGPNDPHAYCKDFVQKRDYEGYLIGQFYPREYQDAYFALRAFYVRAISMPI